MLQIYDLAQSLTSSEALKRLTLIFKSFRAGEEVSVIPKHFPLLSEALGAEKKFLYEGARHVTSDISNTQSVILSFSKALGEEKKFPLVMYHQLSWWLD